MNMKELRVHRGMSQVDLADRLTLQQTAVSRLEGRSDLYVSMLRSFVEALGGKLEIRAVFPGEVIPVTGLDKSNVLESLQGLSNLTCRLHPMPADRVDDVFRVTNVENDTGNVTLEKISNGQSLEIPIRRILEVLPGPSLKPPTIVLQGKLSWTAHRKLWEFVIND